MLNEKELQFLIHWERVRDYESGFMRKLLSGLPMAMLFGLPVLLSVAVVKLFFPVYEMRISKAAGGSTLIIVFIAVLLTALFFAYFRMHLRWEENEQLYKTLKNKQKRTSGAEDATLDLSLPQ